MFTLVVTKMNVLLIPGYDQVPINSMQGLDLGGPPGAAGGYGSHMDNLDLGPTSDLNFDGLDPTMGPSPGDNGGPSMWFDTDL